MPGLEELGWLQFERLCELVLEADAGVDPTRWEGSADQLARGRLRGRAPAPRPDARAARAHPMPVVAARDPVEFAAFPFKSVVTFTNRPAPGDMVYGEEELRDAIRRLPALRMKLPSILSLDAAPPDPDALARSTFDIEATRELARVFVPTPGVEPRRRGPERSTTCSCSPARRRWARPRSRGCSASRCSRRAGRCTRRPGPSRSRRASTARGRSCSSPTTRSARPSTARTPPSAGPTTSTGSCAPPTSTTGSSGPRGPRRCAPACGACTASAAASTSRSPRPSRSTPPRSGVEEKTLILFRHARAADLPPRRATLVRRARRGDRRPPALHARAHPPLRRRAARPVDDVERELREPTEAMATSYAALEREHRELLLAMLDSPPGPVAERDLAAALRRHTDERLPEGAGRPRRPARRPLPAGDAHEGRLGASELARRRDRRAGGATRTSGARFLSRCGVDGAAVALSSEGGSGGRARAPAAAAATPTGTRSATACTPLRRARRGRGDPAAARARRGRRRRRGARAGRARAQAAGLERQGGQRRRDRRVGGRLGEPRSAPAAARGGDDVARARAVARAARRPRSSSGWRTGCGWPSCSPSTRRS